MLAAAPAGLMVVGADRIATGAYDIGTGTRGPSVIEFGGYAAALSLGADERVAQAVGAMTPAALSMIFTLGGSVLEAAGRSEATAAAKAAGAEARAAAAEEAEMIRGMQADVDAALQRAGPDPLASLAEADAPGRVGWSELGNALSDLGTNPLGRNLNRLEEFGPGAGFSGVLDVDSGKFLAYASGETKLANGGVPLNLVDQFGGHADVNAALGQVLGNTSTNRLGFSMTLDEAGNFVVRFNSRTINEVNPNVLNRTVPEGMRQQILDAIAKSTGRKAYSAQ